MWGKNSVSKRPNGNCEKGRRTESQEEVVTCAFVKEVWEKDEQRMEERCRSGGDFALSPPSPSVLCTDIDSFLGHINQAGTEAKERWLHPCQQKRPVGLAETWPWPGKWLQRVMLETLTHLWITFHKKPIKVWTLQSSACLYMCVMMMLGRRKSTFHKELIWPRDTRL